MFALIYSILGSGTSDQIRGVLDITLTNMAEEVESDDSGIKAFFENVLNRTEEILSQSSTAEQRAPCRSLSPCRYPGENGKINRSVGRDSHGRN